MRALILFAFFVSGACALVYEVIWTRLLGLVMGNTVYAVSTTLAAFMAGLALGSYVFGRIADRLDRPGRFYGFLEILIGLYCLALPAFIGIADPLYIFAYREISTSLAVLTSIRFVTAGLILLIPAALMGATLPVLSRLYASRRDRLGWEIGRLYSLNTCGAVVGTLLAGFVLLPALGVRFSLWSTAAVNIGLGVVVLAAARSERPRKTAHGGGGESEKGEGKPLGDGRFAPVAAAFALSGFAALVYEVAWTRIISLLIGPSTYAFALMLACFLVGLALGSALAARWIDRWRDHATKVMGFLLLGGAVSALALLPVLAGAVPYVREITRQHSQSFVSLYAAYFALVALLLLLPTTVLGAVFPTAVRAAMPAMGEVGRKVGQLYAANTVGAIAGSVMGGFLLIPTLGLSRAVAVGAAFHLVAAFVLFTKIKERSLAALCIGVAVVGLVLSPRIDPKVLGSGPYKYLFSDKADADRVLQGRELLYYKEGVTATVSVTRSADQLALAIDGKVDASIGADMDNQILLAHIPLLLSRDPGSVLVIGLASGVTLGSVERHGNVRAIECVEVSPEVIAASAFFSEYNYDALSDPRLDLVVHDARNYLKMTDEVYDVIISEPSNPWMSGSSALFTKEFFENCLSRLNDGGVLCQWLQAYAIPTPMLKSVVATFCEVFQHVSLWMPMKGDLILLGSATPLEIDPESLARRMSEEGLRRDLDRIGLTAWDELAGMNVGLGPELCRAAAGARIQTDSRPLLEFALPRTLHMGIEMAAGNLDWLSGPLGDAGALVPSGEEAQSQVRHSTASHKEYLRGQVMEWSGDLDGALEHYTKALSGAAGRRSAAVPMYLLMCRKGLDLERQGRPEEADRIYRAAVELKPDRSEARYLLGLRLAETGRPGEAAVELDAAVAADPNRLEPVLALGDVLSQLGRHERALGILARSISLAPNDYRAWYGAARIHARSGNAPEARKALARALSLGGPSLRGRAAADSVLAGAGVTPDGVETASQGAGR